MSQESAVRTLRFHPRVSYQGLYSESAQRDRLLNRVPRLVPFKKSYSDVIAVIDWDHHIPSKALVLRMYAYYTAESLSAGESAFDDRLEEIGSRDKFPEFDVPDFADLPADEAYEAEVDLGGLVSECRLTSAWRREVLADDAHNAVSIARGSDEFAHLAELIVDRPQILGDLEAVSWAPPCETGHARWTIDVWYLMAFDGRIGTGRSMLVDLHDRRVVKARDFSVRAH